MNLTTLKEKLEEATESTWSTQGHVISDILSHEGYLRAVMNAIRYIDPEGWWKVTVVDGEPMVVMVYRGQHDNNDK